MLFKVYTHLKCFFCVSLTFFPAYHICMQTMDSYKKILNLIECYVDMFFHNLICNKFILQNDCKISFLKSFVMMQKFT